MARTTLPWDAFMEAAFDFQFMRRCLSPALALFLIITLSAATVPHRDRCNALAYLEIPRSKIIETELLSGEFRQGSSNEKISSPTCRIVVESNLSSGSAITHEIWLPLDDWNKRLLGVGNGGWAGSIQYSALVSGVNRGFTTANSDLGTDGLLDSPLTTAVSVKWLDYGQRATHDMTRVAKIIIAIFYGRDPQRSYFQGCSTGGWQALRNAQFFPDDYDGIISGNAGNERARKVISILYNYMQPKWHPDGIIPNDKLMLMHRSVLKACAGKGGGLPTDPFVTVPQSCQWRPEKLLCRSEDGKECLTQSQVDMANVFYAPLVLKSSGLQVFPGLPLGSELGWEEYMRAASEPEPPHANIVRTALGANFDFAKSDWDHDVHTWLAIQGPLWKDGPNADLSRFRNRGGKLLAYFGLNDTSTIYDFTNYYQDVEQAVANADDVDGDMAAANTRAFFRLFTLPGVEHCGGGNGPNSFDALTPLMNWVEKGEAPERIEAHWTDQRPGRFPSSLGRPMSRPLCVYPQVAHYKGRGDRDKAQSFVCGPPRVLKVPS